jgi:hypothetical protein
MFTAALFTRAKTGNQPRCTLMDEQIKKMWCIHMVEYYFAVKKNAIPSFAEAWMELEIIVFK